MSNWFARGALAELWGGCGCPAAGQHGARRGGGAKVGDGQQEGKADICIELAQPSTRAREINSRLMHDPAGITLAVTLFFRCPCPSARPSGCSSSTRYASQIEIIASIEPGSSPAYVVRTHLHLKPACRGQNVTASLPPSERSHGDQTRDHCSALTQSVFTRTSTHQHCQQTQTLYASLDMAVPLQCLSD